MAKTQRGELGDLGENLAAKFLEKRGMSILKTNLRGKAGEIDLVAMDGETVVFVEVKTVERPVLVAPEEQLTKAKMKHLARTAAAFMKNMDLRDAFCRMDFLGITVGGGEGPNFNHVENAFSVEDVFPGSIF